MTAGRDGGRRCGAADSPTYESVRAATLAEFAKHRHWPFHDPMFQLVGWVDADTIEIRVDGAFFRVSPAEFRDRDRLNRAAWAQIRRVPVVVSRREWAWMAGIMSALMEL